MPNKEKYVNIRASMLQQRRWELGVSVSQLCEGICSVSYYQSIEESRRVPDKLVLDSLMQRAGLITEAYECIVSREEYNIIYTIDQIVASIDKSDLTEFKKNIEAYNNLITDKAEVYKQLGEMLCGYNELLLGNYEAARSIFMKAIKITVSDYDGTCMDKRYLSNLEMVLHVMYIRSKYLISGCMDIQGEVRCFMVQKKLHTDLAFGKLLAYYAQWIAEAAMEQGDKKSAAYVTGQALALLREMERTYNIRNLLKLWAEAAKEDEKAETALWMAEQLEDMYKEFGAEKESACWCIPYATKEIYPIDEFVKSRRIALGMEQIDLAEGICTNRTISNIERGKHEPKPKIKAAILSRLGVNGTEWNEFECDDLRAYEKATELITYINHYDWEKAKPLFEEIKKVLPDSPVNRQYIMLHDVLMEKIHIKKRNINHITELINALELTCKAYNKNIKWFYSTNEINIIFQISGLYIRRKEYDKGFELKQRLINFYMEQQLSMSHFQAGYSMINYLLGCEMANYSDVEKALDITKRGLTDELKNGGSYVLAKTMYDIGWDIEKIEMQQEGKLSGKGIKYMKYSYVFASFYDERMFYFINKNLKEKYNITSLL